ncbi:DUF4369 domain-containing protein [Maribacter polysaccharolyticus]|uniref:DUF4369 domain-containing protein n=1 Tax=Maribacter polysaccharolyticus TaxID=3020831 RepID=UPI00237F11C8|nr:DUF4369 domain-containing protein [Maribacter polysaccharolyticus]MDE3741393.1 DUF4369 domain-containing protein [Maribacter polysaccharolyticus]
MKHFLFFGLIALFIASCNEDTSNTMVVTGNVKGLKKGTLYLQHIPDSILVTIDSLQIEGDGNFTFKTKLESPEIFYLYLNKKDYNDVNDRITFFGEPGNITINTSWNTFDSNANIEGSATQKKLEEYQKVMSRFNKRSLEIIQETANSTAAFDSAQLDSIENLSYKNIQKGYAFALNYALNNKDSYIAPYIALTEVSDANIKYLDSINNSLTPEVADSKYGKELQVFLELRKKKQ